MPSALRDRLRAEPSLDLDTRLQLADLLLAAGREPEALRAFLALSDEAACDGGLATRALAVLRRIEALRPGCDDVEERLVRLAREHARASTAAAPPHVAPAGPEARRADTLSDIERLVAEPAIPDAKRGSRQAAREALSRELLDLVESRWHGLPSIPHPALSKERLTCCGRRSSPTFLSWS